MSSPTTTSMFDRQDPEEPDEPDGKRARRFGALGGILEWIIVIGGALVVALLIKTFLIQAFYIPSSSMVDTLHINDRVLVNKLSYKLHDVHRGDIVVFERPPAQQEEQTSSLTPTTPVPQHNEDDIKDLIKRVIGLPGDEVVIKDGSVWIDGERLDESYLTEGTTTANRGDWPDCTDPQPCVIPEDSVWVMGDNRGSSQDSRYFGPIEEDAIVGRAFLRIWPLGDFGFL